MHPQLFYNKNLKSNLIHKLNKKTKRNEIFKISQKQKFFT